MIRIDKEADGWCVLGGEVNILGDCVFCLSCGTKFSCDGSQLESRDEWVFLLTMYGWMDTSEGKHDNGCYMFLLLFLFYIFLHFLFGRANASFALCFFHGLSRCIGGSTDGDNHGGGGCGKGVDDARRKQRSGKKKKPKDESLWSSEDGHFYPTSSSSTLRNRSNLFRLNEAIWLSAIDQRTMLL